MPFPPPGDLSDAEIKLNSLNLAFLDSQIQPEVWEGPRYLLEKIASSASYKAESMGLP